MDETQNGQTRPEGQQRSVSERRKWHAPQFFVAGLSSTFTQGNAGNDGGAKFTPMES
jgi:hypothetical protein